MMETFEYPNDSLSTRSKVQEIEEEYDRLDLSNVSFVSRAAAHELTTSDLDYFGTDKVEKMMETKYMDR